MDVFRDIREYPIHKSYARAMGLLITANHLEFVLVNPGYEVEKTKRIRLKFSSDFSYCVKVAEYAKSFLEECSLEHELLGQVLGMPVSLNHTLGGAFMEQVKSGDCSANATWENYLDHLAILISNLRMAYDMDIILGGDVGGAKQFLLKIC